MQLSAYVADAASLVRDAGFQITTQARLQRWVNQGRRQLCKVTGCLRTIVPGTAPLGASSVPGEMTPGAFVPGTADSTAFQALEGVERYAYALANPYLRAAYAGYDSVYDVYTVAVSWGSSRPVLRWMPFDELQAYMRAYTGIGLSYPAVWSTLGTGTSGQVWIWPAPSQSLEMEWDVTCLPIELSSDDDPDAIPDNLVSSVKFYAAGMAMLGSFRNAQAEAFFKLFADHSMSDLAGSDGGRVANYYTRLAGF